MAGLNRNQISSRSVAGYFGYDEAASLFLSGEPETARRILLDLVNTTIGFEQLADITERESVHGNLAAIFGRGQRIFMRIRGERTDSHETSGLENLAWIHEAVWIKRAFDGAHHVHLHIAFVT